MLLSAKIIEGINASIIEYRIVYASAFYRIGDYTLHIYFSRRASHLLTSKTRMTRSLYTNPTTKTTTSLRQTYGPRHRRASLRRPLRTYLG